MEPTRSLLSPKAVSRILGVSESSVKRWCDRGLIETVRTAGGHRKMTAGEVIHFAKEHGSLLSAPELVALTLTHSIPEDASADSATRFAEQLLAGDVLAARHTIIDQFLGGQSLSSLFDDVISVAFRIIGERWSCSSVDVYQERRACNLTLGLFQELKQYLRSGIPGRLAIGGTISGDHYEIPSAMAELILRSNRFQTQNLGASIPLKSLENAVRELQPQLFWLSLSHIPDEYAFVKEFSRLSLACTECGTALVVGGQALKDGLRPRLVYSAHCDTMQQLATFAASLQRLQSKTKAGERKRNVRVPNAIRRTGRTGSKKTHPPSP